MVQSASTKYASRSFNVMKLGTVRKYSRSTFRFPQCAASASTRAFWRTHLDQSGSALTRNDELGRSTLNSAAGSTRLGYKCMIAISRRLAMMEILRGRQVRI
jgi:hypothetical protein